MNKYNTGIISLIVILVVSALLLQPGVAFTSNTTSTTASATVLETISVTLSGVPLSFGSLNAGSANNAATGPLNLSIDQGTNVATNLSMNGTGFTCSGGGCGADTFAVTNLSYSNSSLALATTMQTTFPAPPFTNWTNIAKPSGSNRYHNVNFWLTIPTAQTAGTYSTNIYVNVSTYQ